MRPGMTKRPTPLLLIPQHNISFIQGCFNDTQSQQALLPSTAHTANISLSQCLCLIGQTNLSIFRMLSEGISLVVYDETVEFQRLPAPVASTCPSTFTLNLHINETNIGSEIIQ